MCKAAVELRNTQGDSAPGGTIGPLLEVADTAISLKWLWHMCPCCSRSSGSHLLDPDSSVEGGSRLEYVNILFDNDSAEA